MPKFQFHIIIIFFIASNIANANTMKYEQMKTKFGQKKIILSEIEVPAIIALSFYPELKNTPIRFEYKKISTTMSTFPDITSLFSKSKSYVIYINSDVKSVGAVSLLTLSLKQKVGIIAHELAHVLDFEKRNSLSIIQCGIFYKCSGSYHKKLERSTDEMVIKKGLGNELYDFSYYVLNNSNASEEYKAFKKKNYLLPEEIKHRMK